MLCEAMSADVALDTDLRAHLPPDLRAVLFR
jgi:hypothetical protein